VTTLWQRDVPVDQYETRFGVRSLRFDPDSGIFVNGVQIEIKGVNQHHDLGALGAAFNTRAAERQLEILGEMGCNAIRTSHNPPAPEFLELTDRMGFLVMDEALDTWMRKKTPLDFHLIFPDWHEQDLRALVRRDRNCPSVIIWSFGNEVGEQYTGEEGAALAKRLRDIIKEEDPTHPTTSAMNWAKPNMPLPAVQDVISLNYQGQGIRQDPIFEGRTDLNRTPPLYDPFHEKFPDKVTLSSETAHAMSSRGIYLFPVVQKMSDIVRDGRGGDSKIRQVSAYELYATGYGSSADKVFRSLEQHPFVAGEFVWTGWDYLGEPTPYYESRSSYGGIIDLAGFKKDRFYVYQAHWCPELPMAHILPHWNSPYYHRSDSAGIGFDRTKTGSGAVDQYCPEVAKLYGSLETCLENELLWFHHLPWMYKMKSGKTLWDELCYHYYKGVEGVAEIQKVWNFLKGKIDEDEFNREEALLKIQYEDAVRWRDGCVLYFQTFSRLSLPPELKVPEHDLQYYMIHNPR
jgi:beta-galactosidase